MVLGDGSITKIRVILCFRSRSSFEDSCTSEDELSDDSAGGDGVTSSWSIASQSGQGRGRTSTTGVINKGRWTKEEVRLW